MEWPRQLRALNSRNYRLYFFGQIISLIGTWMTSTASLWLIYHLSSSPFQLGLVGFASQVPMFVLAPFAGVWIDRVNGRRLLMLTQVLSMLQSLALAVMTFAGWINVEWLIALSLVQGIINGVDMPARQTLVIAFVEHKEYLSNAIALNSSIFNLARLAGPALAGFTIAAFGPGGCYSIDTISYAGVIFCLSIMRLTTPPAAREAQHPLTELREGFHYAFEHPIIRALLATIALVSLFGFSYSVLTPIFAHDVFRGDSKTLGYLMAASGVGALLAAVYLSSRATVRGLGKVIALGATLMCAGQVGFALSRIFVLSLFCLVITGFGGILVMASSNTLLQTIVEQQKRGRVMSLYTAAFTGTMPLGNLAVGSIAGKWGATVALVFSGICCGVVGLNFFRKLPALRAAAAPYMAKLKNPPPPGT